MVAQGAVSDHVSAFQDMMPTFAELAGVSVPKPTDGVSMAPTLLGKGEQKQHEYLYWELHDRAVRMGNWKAVRTKAGLELFNLHDDMSEASNIAAKHPEIVRKISTIIETAHRDSPFFNWSYTGPVPQDKSKKLKTNRKLCRR